MNPVLGCLHDLWHHFKAAIIWYMHLLQSVSFYSRKFVQTLLGCFFLSCQYWHMLVFSKSDNNEFYIPEFIKLGDALVFLALLVSSTVTNNSYY